MRLQRFLTVDNDDRLLPLTLLARSRIGKDVVPHLEVSLGFLSAALALLDGAHMQLVWPQTRGVGEGLEAHARPQGITRFRLS